MSDCGITEERGAVRITEHEGVTLANGLPLDYHRESLERNLQLKSDLEQRKVTPSSVVGKGYGKYTREVANDWINESIGRARESIAILEGLGLKS